MGLKLAAGHRRSGSDNGAMAQLSITRTARLTILRQCGHGVCSVKAPAMYMPSDITKRPLIDAAVKEIINGSRAHVINIEYDFAKDWSGDWAIFFHVLLSDQASKGVMLGRVTTARRGRRSPNPRSNPSR